MTSMQNIPFITYTSTLSRNIYTIQWPLLWEGEEVFWNSVKKMRAAGYTTIQHLPQESRREGNTGQQMWKAPRLARAEGSDGLRLFRVLIPQGIVSERERGVLQRWFDMIDWHGRRVSKNGKAQMSIQQYLGSRASFALRQSK